MASYDVYDLTANKVGSVDLKDEVFNCEVSEQSVFDAILRQESSLRQGTHKVKNRREVRGGGKKPFRHWISSMRTGFTGLRVRRSIFTDIRVS